MNRRRDLTATAVRLLAPVIAVAFAVAVSAVALLAIGESPLATFGAMIDYAARLDSVVSIVNRAIPLYLSALAVAVGFKMGLFNIGVEGQYRLAGLLAAYAGTLLVLPPVLHVLFIILVAMAVGGAWAGVAGVLKVTRGVHEVISTIMLNVIATGLSAYLLAEYLREPPRPGDLQINTAELAPSAWMPSLNWVLELLGFEVRRGSHLQGFVLVAALAGVLFWLVIWRTRFGYDLRASGLNPLAAQASGVGQGRMVIQAMLLSGAVAGLVAASQILGFFHRYTLDFPVGLGFAGIAVALLGRNHPAGIALAALLFGFLDRSAQILDLRDVPKEIVTIVQGVVILAVVVAAEIARRLATARQTAAVALRAGDERHTEEATA